MEYLLSKDVRPIWFLQSRRYLASLKFWLVLIGYDPKTGSFDSWGYLVYVILFFSAWIFFSLTLLADIAGEILGILPFGEPLSSAIAIGTFSFAAIFLIQLNMSVRRSPFIFSEVDEQLLCLTPVDRRTVCLVWFLLDWGMSAMIVSAGAIVLGYAVLESQAVRDLSTADLPRYFLAGLRMLVIAVPVHLGLQALAWVPGAWRLHKKHDIPWLLWVTPASSIVFIVLWVIIGLVSELFLPEWLWPLSFPFRAGMGDGHLILGLILAWIWAIAGIALLWKSSEGLSLSRAAQETHGKEVLRSALWMGNSDLVSDIRQRERLGSFQTPSRLLVGEGFLVLITRNALQAMRGKITDSLASWVLMLGLGMGILLTQDWATRGFLILLWVLAVAQRSTALLRKDLGRWWLLHQIPFPLVIPVIVDLFLPVIGVWWSSLLSMVLASISGTAVSPIVSWVFIPGSLGVALTAAIDVLRQTNSNHLLDGIVPDLTLVTVLLGALLFAIPWGIVWLLPRLFVLPAWLLGPMFALLVTGFDFGFYLLLVKLLKKTGGR